MCVRERIYKFGSYLASLQKHFCMMFILLFSIYLHNDKTVKKKFVQYKLLMEFIPTKGKM